MRDAGCGLRAAGCEVRDVGFEMRDALKGFPVNLCFLANEWLLRDPSRLYFASFVMVLEYVVAAVAAQWPCNLFLTFLGVVHV